MPIITPHREACVSEVLGDSDGWSLAKPENIHFAGRDSGIGVPNPKKDTAAVRREPWIPPIGHEKMLLSSIHAGHIDSSAVSFGAKHDGGAVGRHAGIVILRLIRGYPDGTAVGQTLGEDVDIAGFGTVGRVGDYLPVARQTGMFGDIRSGGKL